MTQMRLFVILKLLFVAFGSLALLCIVITLFYNVLIDTPKYKKVSYVLRKSDAQTLFNSNELPEADYGNLMNLNFKFTINNLVCQDTNPLLLVLIHSAPKNFEKRKVIRQTWGKSTEKIKILFLLGASIDTETETMLQNENFLYNDFLQGDFLDAYRNMTYKHMMGLKYVVYHCAQTKYVLKIDDDTCVNMPMLEHFFTTDLSPFGAEKLLMCNVIHKARTYRTYRSKWRISFDEFPLRYYPTYCLGWYILYSPDVVFDFYREAQRARYFWIDDVLITGIVAAKLDFTGHTDLSSMTLLRNQVVRTNRSRTFLFGWADMNDTEIRVVWQHILNKYDSQSAKDVLNIG